MRKRAKQSQQSIIRNRRRAKKRAAHEHQRKLKRKLLRIVDSLKERGYASVATSPLLHLNQNLVKRLSR